MKFLSLILLFVPFVADCDQKYDPYGDIPTQKTINELKQYYDLDLSAIGGSMPCGIGRLKLGFTINKSLTVDEARRLIVACAGIYWRNINSSLMTRPFLIEYPFPINRVDVSVNIHHSIKNVDFGSACLFMGKFECRSFEEKKLNIFYEEPFATSLQIVRDELNQKNSYEK